MRALPLFNNTWRVGMKMAPKWRALNLSSVLNEVRAFVIGFLAISYINHVQQLCPMALTGAVLRMFGKKGL